MKQQEIDRLSLVGRANAETPPFFVKLRNIAIITIGITNGFLSLREF